MKKKRICFVCDTPLQIMNTINIIRSFYSSEEHIRDLYLGYSFRNSEEASVGLVKTDIFENVFRFDAVNAKVQNSIMLRTISLLHPAFILKYYNLDDKLHIYQYDTLFISMYNYFTRTVILSIKYNKIYLYEDGVGTYIGTVLDRTQNPFIVKLLNQILFHKKLDFKPEKIYLNNLNICSNEFDAELVELNRLNSNNKALWDIKKIFHYKENCIYKQHRLVYLSQPLEEISSKNAGEIEDALLVTISQMYSKDYVVRIHPRQDKKKYRKYRCDDYENLWELECMNQIGKHNILISSYSTAAFMPMILFNKKPYLFFIQNALGEMLDSRERKNRDQMIDMLRNLYGDEKKRIIVFSSIEEVIIEIKKILT